MAGVEVLQAGDYETKSIDIEREREERENEPRGRT
jgi:hypothetical protein